MRSAGAPDNLAIMMHKPILWYGFAATRATEGAADAQQQDRAVVSQHRQQMPDRERGSGHADPGSAEQRNLEKRAITRAQHALRSSNTVQVTADVDAAFGGNPRLRG